MTAARTRDLTFSVSRHRGDVWTEEQYFTTNQHDHETHGFTPLVYGQKDQDKRKTVISGS